ncbi:RagB/SusD family nutrient uptake outer membrane protein [Parapedobacter sp. 2B3]|uniref:RagB/SusD family nutrient uptake outer membrane protein n=1 Tax=Parapedobacter sp. 2B3 TaxID=3342381 RepID=UPI0035B6775D
MKQFTYAILIFSLMGCNESFLDLHSKTELSSGNFWKTTKDVQIAVNGIYDVLQSRTLYGGSWNSTVSLVHYDSFGDNSWNRIRFEGPGFFIRGTLDPSEALFRLLWQESYKGIARCNEAVANIQKMLSDNLVDASAINEYLGQAYFLRALFYFNLAVYYEDVPLILGVQSLDNAYVEKNSQREVLDQVIADLESAIALLPLTYPESLYGYATKGAANGLLARVLLFDKQFGRAAEAALEVINSNNYDLDFPYENEFTYDGEFAKDIIFSVRFEEAAGFNTGEVFSVTNMSTPKWTHQALSNLVNDYYCADGLSIAESPLYDAANPKMNRDPRLLSSVYFRGDVFIEDRNIIFTANDTGYGIKKYVRSKTTAKGAAVADPGGQDYYLIRYADVLLMRAEALIEDNQLTDEVYALINAVRNRVDMPAIEDVEGTGLSQDQLRKILRHERRVELAFEGHRFFDLKRWGTVEEAYETLKADPVGFPDQSLVNYQGRKSEVFPVPLTELDANPNLEQHDVWK